MAKVVRSELISDKRVCVTDLTIVISQVVVFMFVATQAFVCVRCGNLIDMFDIDDQASG